MYVFIFMHITVYLLIYNNIYYLGIYTIMLY
nr:MAG TPA: hypothetical protein [Caudoviricetes sp.]